MYVQPPAIPDTPESKTEEDNVSYKELHDQSIREIAQEEPKKEEKVEVEKKQEEKPIDIEEVAKKSADEAARKVLEEQREQEERELEQKQKEEESKIDPKDKAKAEYEQMRADFEKENGRNPTWDELAIKIEERTIAKLEERQKERLRIEEEKNKKDLAEREEETKRINTFVDDELNDLYNAGELTRIKDPNNPSDQGVIERRELMKTWMEVNNERRAKGLPEIISATRIHRFYYKRPSAQPPGADAPVSGSRNSSVTSDGDQSYSYQDLKKPWYSFGR